MAQTRNSQTGDISPSPWENADLTDADKSDVSDSETVFSVAGIAVPLVIAAPHGGTLLPTAITDRTSGCMEPDTNSAQLAWTVFKCARERLGVKRRPSLVMGKLHRCKVDLARARHLSAESDAGRAAWDEYHGVIEYLLDEAIGKFGHAHLLDIHGQCHRDATEVGHMLTNSDLRGDCVSSLDFQRSSVAAMSSLPTFTSIDDIVRGPYSIGTLLEKAGYAAVPSSRAPHPCVDCECLRDKEKCDGQICSPADHENYCRPCTAFDVQAWRGCSGGCDFGPCSFFWGANTLAMYGGGRRNKDGEPSQLLKYRGVVAATQLETQWAGARENNEDIEKFGCAVANATVTFMEHFYILQVT